MKLRYAFFTGCALVASVTATTAQPKVLVELFRNVNCGNCRTPDDQLENFLKASPQYNVEKIYFHNEITNPNDPFYLESQASVTQRESQSFYAVASDPGAYVDGISAGSSEGNWEKFIKSSPQALPVQVTATRTKANGKITINYTVSGTTGQAVKAFVLLKESKLAYANTFAYGNPTSGEWDDVFRTTLPDPSGTSQFTASGTQNFSVDYDPSTHPNWNVQNMRAIIVIQTLANNSAAPHAVIGFTAIDLADPSRVVEASLVGKPHFDVLGNPLTEHSKIQIELPSSQKVRITMTDIRGTQSGFSYDGYLPRGESDLEIGDIHLLPSGVYLLQMYVDGVEVDARKVVTLP